MSFFITQLIYIKPGSEKIFDEFEALAIPIISKYNGKLLLRIRPDSGAIIESNTAAPYEIHLVEFDDEERFRRFMKDDERQQFLHLKEASISSSVLIKGELL